MDPNKTLADLRDYASRLLDEVDRANKTGVADFSSPEEAYTIAEQLEALDEWLSRGGFLPSDWQSQTRNVHERIDAIERERELDQARKHTYRPYDTSRQDHA